MQFHPSRALCLLLLTSSLGRAQTANSYKQTNLISDGSVAAQTTDKTLINPWGVAIGQQTPFWINNAGSGTSAVYDAGANKQFAVKIPSGGAGTNTGSPAGIVFNTSASDFILNGEGPAFFIFGSLDGTISAWNPALTDAQRMIDNSTAGAVYTGVTLANNATGNFILAANMGTNAVDVFDTKFASASLAGKFVDPTLPSGFAPFNVHTLGSKVYVLYAMQTPGGGPPTTGAGLGFVSVFDTSGNFLARAISGGNLNAPWGIAVAPAGFGAFGGDLLVGNFGDGTINAYDPNTFTLVGQMQDANGKPVQNDRLWEIVFGQNGTGDPNTLYFSAGVNDEKGGLFGAITSAATPAGDFGLDVASPTLTIAQGGSATLGVSITSTNGFNGPVTFTASGVPAGMSVQFSPATVTPANGQTATTTLTVTTNPSTTAPGPYGFLRGGPSPRGSVLSAGALFPLGLIGLWAARRSQRKRVWLRTSVAGVLSLALGGMAMIGCSGANSGASGPASPAPTAGTFAITVTATSGSLSHAKTFSLAVQYS